MKRSIKAGDVVEVWDMALGDWVPGRAVKSGAFLSVIRPVVRCTVVTEGRTWRRLLAATATAKEAT